MKKLFKILVIGICLLSSNLVFSQSATKLPTGSPQGIPIDSGAITNVVTINTTGAMNQFLVVSWPSIKVTGYQLNRWWNDSLSTYTKRSRMTDSLNVLRSSINNKLTSSDTTGKWRPMSWSPDLSSYLHSIDTTSLSNRINKRLLIADTTLLLRKTTASATYQLKGTYIIPTDTTVFLRKNGSGASLTGLTKSQVGLSNVDNTSDNNKPISTATQTALNGKQNSFAGSTSQYVRGDASLATFPTIPTNTNQLTNGSGYVDQSGARSSVSMTNSGTSGNATYNQTTGVINVPNYTYTFPTTTINNGVNRTLNSNYTISSTRYALASYSINAAWSLNALLSGNGAAYLEYSTNSGSTWITINQVGKVLNLLTFAGSDDMNLVGFIPPNALVRIRTSSTNMTITYITDKGQEVLLF